MKKLLLIPVLILFSGGLWFYLEHSLPSDETVKQEFSELNSDVEIISVEFIFDHAPKKVLTYLVKYKEPKKQ